MLKFVQLGVYLVMPRYQKISEMDKRRLVAAFEDDAQDYLEVARILNIKRTTAWSIIQRHIEHGVVVRPRGGHRDGAQKVDGEMTEVLVAIVAEFPAYTLTQINTELQRRLPQKPVISVATVCKMLDAQLITTKKLEDAPMERNSDATKAARHEYATWLMEDGVNRNLVFVDEAGYNLYTRRTRGRAERGQRAVRQVAGCRGRNLNIILAISPGIGTLYYELYEGTVNGEVFQTFLSNLGDVIGEETNVVVVMDNAPVHRNCSMEYENHSIQKLPPYSPMLNPIEMAFSCMKAAVKQLLNERMAVILDRAAAAAAGQTLTAYRMQHLRQAVTEVIERPEITDIKCTNWHTHALGYIPRCLALQQIDM